MHAHQSPSISVQMPSKTHLVLTFDPSFTLESIVSQLPFAREVTPGTWRVGLCYESVSVLIGLHAQGTVSTDVAGLVGEADAYPSCRDGIVTRFSSDKYPLAVEQAWRTEDPLLSRIAGGYERKSISGLVYPPTSAGAIARLVYEGSYADPTGVFPRAEAVVVYDGATGDFCAFGDPRVEQSLDRFFPHKDVVAAARSHGVDVQFSDPFTEEVYYGELARHSDGIQPEGITFELFPYQKTAVAQMVERTGLGIFLAPGLGKTLVAIAGGQELLNQGQVGRVLITPPAAVSAQWVDEIIRFTGIDESNVVRIYGGPKQRQEAYRAAEDAQWVVVHHDLLRLELNQIRALADGALVVFDEAHKGATYGTKRTEAMGELARISARRVALTGTPVPNAVNEWYSILGRQLVPGLFGSGKDFCQRYQYPDKFGKGYSGVRRLDELADRSRAHFIRHTKADVATHLPPLQIKHMPVKVDADYRRALITAHLNAADALSDQYERNNVEDSESVGNMTAYGMLRAVCSSPRLLHMSDSPGAKALIKAGKIPDIDGPKVDKVRQIARALQDRGERIVMFSYSRELIKLIADRFDEDGIRYVTYHGETKDADRIKAVKAFQAPANDSKAGGDNPTVFLATDAAAEGLNLGHQCCTLLNIDLPWTAGRLDQRYNRIHRVDGTHQNYLAVNMTIAGTVEDSILRKVESKAGIADVLFGERSADEITGRGSGSNSQQAVEEAMRDWRRSQQVHT